MRNLIRRLFRKTVVKETFYGYPVDTINDLSDGCTGIPELDSPHKPIINWLSN